MASKPARRIHNTDSLGASGYNSFFKNSAYSLSSTAPRYILVLPIMWKSTKPISAIPEMAIAYFLPTAVPYRSSSNGRRGRGAAAVPVTGWREGVVVLIRGVVSLHNASSQATSQRPQPLHLSGEARLIQPIFVAHHLRPIRADSR